MKEAGFPKESGLHSMMGLSLAINDTTLGQIIRGECNTHGVTRNNPDIMLAHFARKMGKDNVLVLQFHTEHSIRKCFANDAFNFNCFFFGHKSSKYLLLS